MAKKLTTDPTLENAFINSGVKIPTGLPTTVSGIYTTPQPIGYTRGGLVGNQPTPIYAPTQPKTTLPKVTTVPTTTPNSRINPVTVTKYKDNADGTTTNYLSDGTTSKVRYTKNPNGSFTPYEIGNTTSTATPGSANAIAQSVQYNPYVNPDQATIDAARGLITDTTQETDPNKLYQQTLQDYQAQIDSINTLYADQINRARIEGQGRIESRQFAQGRAGQIGSGTGEAGINAVQDANEQVIRSIEAEKANAIAEIYSKVRTGASDLLKANTEAKKAGAKALLEFYNVEKPAIKKKNLSEAVKSLVSKGIDVKSMTPEDIKSFTDGIGVSKDEFTSAFTEYQKEVKAAEAKAEQDAMKALPAAAQEYEYAKKYDGYKGSFTQYQNEDANRKARSAGSGAKLTISEQQAGVVQRLAAGLVPGATIPNSGGVPFIDNNGFLTVDGFKAAINAAQQTGLPRKEFLQEFGSYLAPMLLQSYGVTPKEIKDISGELPVTK